MTIKQLRYSFVKLGDQLESIRKAKNISSYNMNISHATVHNIESGLRGSIESLIQLADELGFEITLAPKVTA